MNVARRTELARPNPAGDGRRGDDPAQWPEAERDALLRVAAAAAGASRLTDVLELAAEEARDALGAASLSVSRWERDADLIRTMINVGELGPDEERSPTDETYPAAEYPLVAEMLRSRTSYFNERDDPGCDPAARRILEQLEKGCDVGVAIVVEGAVWGEIWATRRAGDPVFRARDARFLETIADQCALAIGRAELFSRVSRFAYEDTLTGLPNRRALNDRLDRAFRRFAAEGSALTLLVCDLDGLKQINDSEGHDAGDRALRAVAGALVAAVVDRPGTLVARLSGDEFCVLLEGEEIAAVSALWAAALVELGSTSGDAFSLSGGASQVKPKMKSSADLLRAADRALYVAKRGGGNRLYSALEDSPMPPRPVRGGDAAAQSIAAATEALALELDGKLADASVVDRLEAVAIAYLAAGDFVAWGASVAVAGSAVVMVVSFGDREFPEIRVGFGADEYELRDFPVTAAIVSAGSGCFAVRRLDPDAEESEVELLEQFGFESVIGVAATHRGDVYLLEMYGDRHTVPLEQVGTSLRLLMRAAMPAR